MLKRQLGFGMNLVAIGLFFPGILLPMFALDMEMAANVNNVTFTSPLVNKELSIIATVRELWQDNRIIVASLIFLFSVCVPLFKSSLVTAAYFQSDINKARKILSYVTHIGKWSMADVFVVAVFLAILSTNHGETANSHELTIFGFKMGLDVSTQTLSNVGHGFYFFTAHCLVSLAGVHLFYQSARTRLTECQNANQAGEY